MVEVSKNIQVIPMQGFQPTSYKDCGRKYLNSIDFRNIQQNSYYSFINNTLRQIFSERYEDNKYVIEVMDYYLDSSDQLSEQLTISNKGSLEYSLYATLKITLKSTNKIKHISVPNQTVIQKALITKFPKMIDNHFIINGLYKCAINHLEQGFIPFIKEVKLAGGQKTHILNFSVNMANLYIQEKDKVHGITLTLPYTSPLPKLLQGAKTFSIGAVLNNIEVDETEIYKIICNHPILMSQVQHSVSPEYSFDYIRTGFKMDDTCRMNINTFLSFRNTLTGKVAAENFYYGPRILLKAGEVITSEKALQLQELGIISIPVLINKNVTYIYNNGMVDIEKLFADNDIPLEYIPDTFKIKNYDDITKTQFETYMQINRVVFERLRNTVSDSYSLRDMLADNYQELAGFHLTREDSIALINYYSNFLLGTYPIDDRDSLTNKRIVNVKDIFEELLYRRMYSLSPAHSSILTQLHKSNSRHNITSKSDFSTNVPIEFQYEFKLDCPDNLTITKQILSNHLFQSEEDINNTISQCVHTRKVTFTTMEGRGGVSPTSSDLSYRSLNPSFCGRLDSVATPEGKMIGLVRYVSTLAKVTAGGEILAPFFKVDKENKVIDYSKIYFLPYSEETKYCRCISPVIADEDKVEIKIFKNGRYYKSYYKTPLYPKDYYIADAEMYMLRDKGDDYQIVYKKKDWFVDDQKILAYVGHGENIMTDYTQVDFVTVRGEHIISPVTAIIPLIEFNENNRNMMAGFHDLQAITTLRRELQPTYATIAKSSIPMQGEGVCISPCYGSVYMIDEKFIYIEKSDDDVDSNNPTTTEDNLVKIPLLRGKASPEKTFIYSTPIVNVGTYVYPGMVLADNSTTINGEVANGFGAYIGYVGWNGYNFEDAILVNQDVIRNGYGISFHLRTYTVTISGDKIRDDKKYVPKERQANQASDYALLPNRIKSDKRYGANGIILPASSVKPGEYLGGKVVAKINKTGNEVSYIFKQNCQYDQEEEGYVLSVNTRNESGKLSGGGTEYVDINVIYCQTYKVGDKSSGQHGNKGVISKIVPASDMPYFANGRPLDFLFAPLGVPSRMNLAQFITGVLGLMYKSRGIRFEVSAFEPKDSDKILKALNVFDGEGKLQLYDGRTGDPIYHKCFVTYNYIYKSEHTAVDKLYGRGTGAYTLIDQPTKGKANNGGQRLGEMEGDNEKAHGCVNVTMELRSTKSGDAAGRKRLREMNESHSKVESEQFNLKGNPSRATKESFNILRAQGYSYEFYNSKGEEIDINLNMVDGKGVVRPYTLEESLEKRRAILDKYKYGYSEYEEEDVDSSTSVDYSRDEVDEVGFEDDDEFETVEDSNVNGEESTQDSIVYIDGLDMEESAYLTTIYNSNFLSIQKFYDLDELQQLPLTSRMYIFLYDQQVTYAPDSNEIEYMFSMIPADEITCTYSTREYQLDFISGLYKTLQYVNFHPEFPKEHKDFIDILELNPLYTTLLAIALAQVKLTQEELLQLYGLFDIDELLAMDIPMVESYVTNYIQTVKQDTMTDEELYSSGENPDNPDVNDETSTVADEYDDEDDDVYFGILDN